MKIIDNILFDTYFDELKKIVYSSDFGWFYHPKTTHSKDDNNFMFCHTLYDLEINSSYFEKFKTIIHFISNYKKVNKLYRMKFNLYTNQGKKIKHHSHYDYVDINKKPLKNVNIAIINFTTCNGATIIEDKEILSKSNQMICFSNDKKHYGVTQNDEKIRIVLNLAFE